MQARVKCVWMTGLSGAGKSTLAASMRKELEGQGIRVCVLDGDILRSGLNSDLGMSDEDRTENIRRMAHVAKILSDCGILVIVAAISPFLKDRFAARSLFDSGDFIEVHVSTPIFECERRDVKGLYRKARSGEIAGFTGIDSPYEPPVCPDVVINTEHCSVADAVGELLGSVL